MAKARLGTGLSLFVLALTCAGTVHAQGAFPSKPIRLVTSAPGGGGDLVSRIISESLAASIGQPVIVENRGSPGVVQAQIVAKAQPDGHTLLVIQNQLWVFPFLQDKVAYHPVRDFTPITQADTSPNILVVHPSLPVRTVKELITYAKARPGELNYARPSTGGPTHLAAELLNEMAGLKTVGIAYKGGAAVGLAILSNEVGLGFVSLAGGGGHIKANRLIALGVSTLKRSILFPDIPTLDESGLPGFEAIQLNVIFAPSATPTPIVRRLHREIVEVLRKKEVQARFLAMGVETVGNSPEEIASYIKSDMAKWGKLIKSRGIREN